MRATLRSTASLQRGVRQAVRQQAPVQAWAPLRRAPCPPPALQRCLASSSSSSDGSSLSRSASSASGWLLDTASSLGVAYSTNTSSNGSSFSSSRGSGAPFDAIMMLGGGLLPDGGLPQWCVRRLEGCIWLYEQQIEAAQLQALEQGAGSSNGSSFASRSSGGSTPGACPIVLLGAGTPHKPPPIDANGFALHEATAYAEYLLRRGVPAGDLLKETQSCDTVGNGYFSLMQHALPAGWRRIAVVTSEFHMPRTSATFDVVYALAGRTLYGDANWFQLDYRAVSDEGLFPEDVLAARAEKEAAAVAAWHRNTEGMASLADFHRWLYATHLCYSVSRQHEFGQALDLDPKLAATY